MATSIEPQADSRWLSGNLKALSTVSFFTDVHSEIILALLPVFMAQVLGLSKTMIGVIEGLAAGVPSIIHPLAGRLSDWLGRRKPLIAAGYALSTIVKVLMVFVYSFGQLLTVRVADRVGKGLRTAPRDALLADAAARSKLGRVFGFHRMADTLGAVVGSGLGFVLLTALHGQYHTAFLWAGIAGVLAVFVLLIGVREPRLVPHQSNSADENRLMRPALLPAPLKLFLVAHALFSLGNFTYAFFVLRAHEVGIAESLVPLLYLVYNIAYALAAFPAGRLADVTGARPVLVAAYALFAGLCLALAVIDAPAAMWGWLMLYGLHSATVNPASRAMAATLVTPDSHGLAMGLLSGLAAGLSLLGSICGGLLWDYLGGHATFAFGAACGGGAALILAFLPAIVSPNHKVNPSQ